MERFNVRTGRRVEFIDITRNVHGILEAAGVASGICVLHVPHTTAALLVNENADPAVPSDIISWLARAVPEDGPYRHVEGNSDAHIKASLIGNTLALPVEGGRLALGTWEGVFFCEFDGPRERTVNMKVVGS
ncbi:MAG: secondary thiamine-phosphate synthase enzyme YjbQ [Candidatus Geothermincolia bacterium]